MSFEVGDKVFDMQYGAGKVIENSGTLTYPITVCFLDNRIETYTVEGRHLNSFAMPTLYFEKPYIVDTEPYRLPDLAMDTPVLVRLCNNKNWRKRHFYEWGKEGKCVAWDGGGTSWSANTYSTWTEWKLPKDVK